MPRVQLWKKPRSWFQFSDGLPVQVIGQFLLPGLERRREQWFKELADDFDRLKQTVDGFSVENLAQNDAFVSATIQATRIAIGTHQEKKREYLRNALLNIAVGKTRDEVKQQIFLSAVEAFTPAHVQALDLIWRGAAARHAAGAARTSPEGVAPAHHPA